MANFAGKDAAGDTKYFKGSGAGSDVDPLILERSTARKAFTYQTGQAADSGDNTVIAAPGAGQRIVVTAIEVQNATAVATTVVLKNGATAVWTRLLQYQGDGLAFQWQRGDEWLLGDNAALVVNLSAANSHNVSVKYYTEAV